MHPVVQELQKSQTALSALVSRVYYLQGRLKQRDTELDRAVGEAERAVESSMAIMVRIERRQRCRSKWISER